MLMTKQPEFYNKYINAFFKRAKADTFPMAFMKKEARKVLKGEELDALDKAVDELVTLGALQRDGDSIKLIDKERIPLQAP